MNRYVNRRIIKNDSSMYTEYFSERDKKQILQYDTAVFNYPNEDIIKRIGYFEHVWSTGDRLYKLSQRYLGDKSLWWIILKFNKIGSEFNIKNGDMLKIPAYPEEVIGIFL